MKCEQPVQAWKSRTLTKNGKEKLVFNRKAGYGQSMLLPCGHCYSCAIVKSNQWAVRAMHEAGEHEENAFITLTYNNSNLPLGGGKVPTLHKPDVQKFIKRYRKRGHDFRYIFGAEYGDRNGRPHYHGLVFGHQFKDLVRLARTRTPNKNPKPLHMSPTLQELWPQGFNSIGELTFQSAAYVARYCSKKSYGAEAFDKYKYLVNQVTGDVVKASSPLYQVAREFEDYQQFKIEREWQIQSLKPAIGVSWLERWWRDISNDGFITVRKWNSSENKFEYYPMRVPRYYLKWLENHEEKTPQHDKFMEIKQSTLEYHEKNPNDWYEVEREATLKTRRTLSQKRAVELPRNLDTEELRIAI